MWSGYKHNILVSTDTLTGDAAVAINGNFVTIGNLFDGVAISGTSGISGYSGYSGVGSPGVSGYSGYSGISATGVSGVSGYSGRSGFSGVGTSGFSGAAGASGASGASGYSGYSGVNGLNGTSGISGYSGKSGYSGYSGIIAITMSPNDTATITFNSSGNNETQYSPSLASLSSVTLNLPTATKVGQSLIYICTNYVAAVSFSGGTILGTPSLGAMNSGQAIELQATNTTGTFVGIFTPAS